MRLKKLLAEPLIHFLIGAACVFMFFWVTDLDKNSDAYVISISEAEINGMLARFEQAFGRAPRAEERAGLISDAINEEIYYREARHLGLDDNDPIIRRRLMTKMRYLHSDTADNDTPSDEALQQWLSNNAKDYVLPAYYDLEQIYIGQTAQWSPEVLERELKKLNQSNTDNAAATSSLSAALSIPSRFRNTSATHIERLLGSDFANALISMPVGQWLGPVVSGYGLHLVKIVRSTPEKPARLEDVRQQVTNDWKSAARAQALEEGLNQLRAKYEIRAPTYP